MNWNIGNLQGLIPLLGGIFIYLLAKGVLPRKPRDKELFAPWRLKFGPLLKVISPLVVLLGIAQLLGLL